MDSIILENKDGSVDIMIPAKGYSLDQLIKNNIPDSVVNYRKADSSTFPDRDLRKAWCAAGDGVAVDIAKARDIANDLRRKKRSEYFEPRLEIIQKDAMGIPLKSGESAATAKAENKAFKDKDDSLQSDIDNSSESELLSIVKQLKG